MPNTLAPTKGMTSAKQPEFCQSISCLRGKSDRFKISVVPMSSRFPAQKYRVSPVSQGITACTRTFRMRCAVHSVAPPPFTFPLLSRHLDSPTT